MTRTQHLNWCKQRALQYCDAGDESQAFASMSSDLKKHPETSDHPAIQMGMMMLLGGHIRKGEMRKFIEGLN